jgi:hypothetical protein
VTSRCVRPERKAQRWPVLSIDEEGMFRGQHDDQLVQIDAVMVKEEI